MFLPAGAACSIRIATQSPSELPQLLSPDHPGMRFDDIGSWSEVKLEIIRKYAAAYSSILAHQRRLHYDAFAGAGST